MAERARALRRFWELEGGVVINSVVAELVDAARDDDPSRVIAVYQDAVAVLGRIWHEWFSARIRLAAITIGAIADALPRLSAAERTGVRRPRSSGCTARATRCSTSTPTPPASGAPRAGPG